MTVLLTAKGVHVEFGSLVAVRDVSFELSGGQLLGLVGPNGAGKTTLLRVLAGLHAPTRGAACVMGKPVLGEHEVVRHHIGFGPDAPPAYEDLTIDQFLRFIAGAYGLPEEEAGERIDFWLEQLWLTAKRRILVKHLSRGMRQRVMLARTFIPKPHVILLDEPLAGLDPAGRRDLRRILGMLREQGCAMIVSSHILADLEEMATHITIIAQGSILRWSTTGALHHEQDRRRTYRLGTLDDDSDVARIITAIDGVSDLRQDGRTFTFDYHAEEQAAADLLRQLVSRNIPVLSFVQVKTSLEEVYLRSGVKQVD
jgi:ABC-2 type transport system ATP-binding protein